mmetsp:Transcript_50364/g.109370  ORF Transcript_50364/g.109370 Transcript_50364/m.109370 type:complete len:113 (+) Transcript_50364:730-1068(+)
MLCSENCGVASGCSKEELGSAGSDGFRSDDNVSSLGPAGGSMDEDSLQDVSREPSLPLSDGEAVLTSDDCRKCHFIQDLEVSGDPECSPAEGTSEPIIYFNERLRSMLEAVP